MICLQIIFYMAYSSVQFSFYTQLYSFVLYKCLNPLLLFKLCIILNIP